MGIDYGIKSYSEINPNGEGTATRWEFLGPERDRLRRAFVTAHPKHRTPEESERFARLARIAAEQREAESPKLSALP